MPAQRSSAERPLSVHQLKVQLEGTKPPVWRRLVVPSDVALGSLHDVIQMAFGWQDTHLHAFEDRSGGRYAPPGDFGLPAFDEKKAVLADVLPRTGDRMNYTYDFGDDWLHLITVEAVRPAQDGEGSSRCARAGGGPCPPPRTLAACGGWPSCSSGTRTGSARVPRSSGTAVRSGWSTTASLTRCWPACARRASTRPPSTSPRSTGRSRRFGCDGRPAGGEEARQAERAAGAGRDVPLRVRRSAPAAR
ncbi:plasmid pRiA4b ORF-3 family protein [Streptomyces chiangmaiensis]